MIDDFGFANFWKFANEGDNHEKKLWSLKLPST